MTSTVPVPVRARRARWVRTVWHHPEWATAAVAVAAWAGVLALHPAGHGPHATASLPVLVGTTLVMTVAMMLPSVLPAVRVVALTGPWRRRYRSQALFTGAYLAAWLAAALGLAGLAAFLPPVPWTPTAALLVAAAWELSRPKRRFLRACHLVRPPTGTGRRADAACARAGLRNAAGCIGSCWALMAVMVLTTSLPLMVLLTAVATVGKVLRQGTRLGPELAAALVAAAVYTAVL